MGVHEPIAPTSRTDSPERAARRSEGAVLERRELPSGHSLVILAASGRSEAIEIRSPQGEVQVRIACGLDGPVVSLSSARLELEAPTVAIRCERFEVEAEQDLALRSPRVEVESSGTLDLHARGDVHLESDQDLHLDGKMLRLNCAEEASGQPTVS